MRRLFGAVLLMLTASCASGDVVETAEPPDSERLAPATAVPTTAAALLPPATPTAVSVPTRAPAIVTVVATATAVPTATAEPVATPVPTAAVAGGAALAPTAVPAPTASNASAEVMAANGAEVYTIACARCHGENGTGSDRYGGLLFVGNRYSSSAMIEELTNGHPITFGFVGQLSADEIASVVAYVKATFP